MTYLRDNSAQGVGNVFLPEHPSLPRADLRHHIREKPERIVGREDRYPKQISHRNQDEEMLHAGARSHRLPGHFMGGHPVHDVPENLENATFFRFLIVSHSSPSLLKYRAGRILLFPRIPYGEPSSASTCRFQAPRTE